MQQKKACQYDAYMLHAPKACVHEYMRTCTIGPIRPMALAKPAESLHESMHASRDIYNLLILIHISTRNMKLKIPCPSRGMCTNTVHSADMLACTCTHGWSRQMAQIIYIYMGYIVPGAGAGPACMGRAVHARGKCQNLAFQHMRARMPHACRMKACYCMFISTHMGILSSPKRPHEARVWHAACDSIARRPNGRI